MTDDLHTEQIERRLTHLDAEMTRRDELIGKLASSSAQHSQMLTSLADSVGSLGTKLDNYASQQQMLAGKSGRLDLQSIAAMAGLIVLLWGFAIAPLTAKVDNNEASISDWRSEQTERERERYEAAISQASNRGYTAARIDELEEDSELHRVELESLHSLLNGHQP